MDYFICLAYFKICNTYLYIELTSLLTEWFNVFSVSCGLHSWFKSIFKILKLTFQDECLWNTRINIQYSLKMKRNILVTIYWNLKCLISTNYSKIRIWHFFKKREKLRHMCTLYNGMTYDLSNVSNYMLLLLKDLIIGDE